MNVRQKQKEHQMKMYNEYTERVAAEPGINKAKLRRELAKKFKYTSENSINTIIWKIENNR